MLAITLKEKLKIKVAKWGTPKNILKTKQKNCIFEGFVIFSENDSDAFQIQIQIPKGGRNVSENQSCSGLRYCAKILITSE